MSIDVIPRTNGPDYTGEFIIEHTWPGKREYIDVDLQEARELFGQLGEMIKMVEANMNQG